ncbi:phytoene/squalene synthase family protein [Fluviispira multicolorata]|uniref:Phytoene synthase n=1 Tax=Fluviispira multicolorata TaxID=2654512 RepID=A0A833JHB1_9BACT|nr:phytoene/squalene synthase family protein [Fluviispira multicolorata]KAB8033372.1 hypothetical protein GCL57_01340 [Fluviispira multicolorata]
MNILEIEKAEIAKIEYPAPFLLSKFLKNICYEWLYFEITYENQHILCILSTYDPFTEHNYENIPATVYLTWYEDNNLLAYSYTVFSNSEREHFENKIESWLNGTDKYLEFILPCHSLKKIIKFSIINPFKSYNKNDISVKKLEGCSKKHFWQLLTHSLKIDGSISTVEVTKDDLKYCCERYSFFYDKYLQNKLLFQSAKRIQFREAKLYFDHNAGTEKLSKLKNNWFWWHCEKENSWEVCYYFPKYEKAFYVNQELGEQNAIILETKTTEIVVKYAKSCFFLKYPEKISSPLFGEVCLNLKIESAPFYFRVRGLDKFNITLEILNPNNIAKKITQILMGARKIFFKSSHVQLDDFQCFHSLEYICKNITKNNGKSFYLASHVLLKEQRNSAYFIYALCRLIDDATDEFVKIPNLRNALQGASFSNKFLSVLWGKDSLVAAHFLLQVKERISFCLFMIIDLKSAENFVFEARRKVIEFNLEKKHFEELIIGQKMDENFSQPQNFNDFYLYCYRVAGVVGHIMAKIFKVSQTNDASVAAEHLGIAMQITNILRDIKQDFENGRVYIPKSYCEYYNIKIDNNFFSENNNLKNLYFIDDLSNQAINYYISAYQGIKSIPTLRARFCVRLMLAIYGSILGKILIDKQNILKQRTVISKITRIFIFFKIILGFSPIKVAKLDKNFRVDRTVIL